MREVTKYYSEYSSRPFDSRLDCLDFEENYKKRAKEWESKSAASKLDQLRFELSQQVFIPDETIATCTFDALIIKGLVKVCQKFVEENKEYLDYY
jgi:hypothetical protein